MENSVLIKLFLLTCHFSFVFSALSLTQWTNETTTTAIQMLIEFDASTATLKRGTVIIATSAAGTISNGAPFLDTNFRGDVDQAATLEPGKSYSYTLEEDTGGSVTLLMCTKALEPENVNAVPLGQDSARVAFRINGGNFEALSGFTLTTDGISDPIADPIAAGTASVDVTGMGPPFEEYQFSVIQRYECGSGTGIMLNSGPVNTTVRLAPDNPSIVDAPTADADGVLLELTFPNKSSDLVYRLRRDGVFQVEFSYAMYVDFDTDTGDYNDSGLTPGTQYEYDVVAEDLTSGLTVSSTATTTICTEPGTVDTVSYLNTPGTPGQVTLSWAQPLGSVTTYYVHYAGASPETSTTTSAAIAGLNSADSVVFQIQTEYVCPFDSSALTGANVSKTVYTSPAEPMFEVLPFVSSSEGLTKLQVAWAANSADAVAQASLFKWTVRRSDDGGVAYQDILTKVDYATQFHVDTDLTPATEYYYSLIAYYNNHATPTSTKPSACTLPEAPQDVSVVTVSSTDLSCTWSEPTNVGSCIASYQMQFNGVDTPGNLTLADTTQVVSTTPSAFGALYDDAANVCYVRTISPPHAVVGSGSSVWASAEGYLKPVAPNVTVNALSSSMVEITVVPADDNLNVVNYTATIFRDGVQIVANLPHPWYHVDTGRTAGFQYAYTALVKYRNTPSLQGPAFDTCTLPNEVDDLVVTSAFSSNLTVTWTIPSGQVEAFVVQGNELVGDTGVEVIDVTSGVTDYSADLVDLEAESCYSVIVKTMIYCDATNAFNQTSVGLTLRACTPTPAPNITVSASKYNEITVVFNETSPLYTYKLWRGALRLTSSADVHRDSLDLVPGQLYCYTAAVEVNQVTSPVSQQVCTCAMPSAVTELQVIVATDRTLTVEWVVADDGYEYTRIVVNNVHTNDTSSANTFAIGSTNTADIPELEPNSPYAITITNEIVCNDTAIISEPMSITAFTNAQRPVLSVNTSAATPPTVSVEFYLPSGVSGYSFSLERNGIDIAAVTNPFNDANLEPATQYSYRGHLIGASGSESPVSQTINVCTHPNPVPNLRQTNATVDTVTVAWDALDYPPSGYYAFLNNFLEEPVLGVDAAATATRVYQSATGGARIADNVFTAVLDSPFLPGVQFSVGVLACLDCSVTDSSALMGDDSLDATAQTIDVELCSSFATASVYTRPLPASCIAFTRGVAEVQIDYFPFFPTNHTFTLRRSDLGDNLATGLAHGESPYTDTRNIFPGREYTYTVLSVIGGYESEDATCTQCAQPAPPNSFDGAFDSDTEVSVSWDEPTLDSEIDSYEVAIEDDAFVPASGSFIHTFSGLSPSTCYTFYVRSKVDCAGAGSPVYSDSRLIKRCTRPAKCVLSSVEPVDISFDIYQRKLHVTLEPVFNHSYRILRASAAGLLFDEIATLDAENGVYLDRNLLSGTGYCYKCVAVLNQIDGEASDRDCACTLPGTPADLQFNALSDQSIEVTWTTPNNDGRYTSFEVTHDLDSSAPASTAALSYEWSSGLEAGSSYMFYVRTYLDCTATGAASNDLFSDWAKVQAYTAPSEPVLMAIDSTTSTVLLDVENAEYYDEIRVFLNGLERTPIPHYWPHTVENLAAGTSYEFYVVAYKNGLTNRSSEITYCTTPNAPTNLRSSTRHFYGFELFWDPPISGAFSGYSIWTDADQTQWFNVTPILSAPNAKNENIKLYNFDVSKDFSFTFTPAAGAGNAPGIAPPFIQVSGIESGGRYLVKAHTYKVCSVVEADGTTTDRLFFSHDVLSEAVVGAHPVVSLQAESVSQTEIQLYFDMLATQVEQGTTFTIYRYNGHNQLEQSFTGVTLAQLPLRDTGLDPASFYYYTVAAQVYDVETDAESRTDLVDDYMNSSQSMSTFEIYFPPEPQVSADNSIQFYYFKQRSACTYPPNPSSMTSMDVDYDSFSITWTVDDYSHVSAECFPWNGGVDINGNVGCIQVEQRVYLEGEYVDTVAGTDPAAYTFDNLPNPRSAYWAQVATALICPDDNAYLDDVDYTAGSTAPYNDSYTLLSFNSAATDVFLGITGYTKPSNIPIVNVTMGLNDPTTELRVDYGQQDRGVVHEAVASWSESLLTSPFPTAQVSRTDTTPYLVITGLKSGQPYSVSARSRWVVDDSLTIFGNYAPEAVVVGDYEPLTANGQTVAGEPIYACTYPADVANATVYGIDNQTAGVTFDIPDGLMDSYNVTVSVDGSVVHQVMETIFPYFTPLETITWTYSELVPCVQFTISVVTSSSCGVNLERQWALTSVTGTAYTSPNEPTILLDSTSSVDADSVYVAWAYNPDSMNDLCTRPMFTVYRDDVPVSTSTATELTDSGLTAGTVYTYHVTSTFEGQTGPPSDDLQLCTYPIAPHSGMFLNSSVTRTSFAIEWQEPSEGGRTGFFLNDGQENTNTRLLASNFSYVDLAAGSEYSYTITLQSYLSCDVTGQFPEVELTSSDSHSFSFTACTAPVAPRLSGVLEDSMDYLLEVHISEGGFDHLTFDLNEALSGISVTSADGSFTRVSSTQLTFEASVSDTSLLQFNFAGLSKDTKYELSVHSNFDCSLGLGMTSEASTLTIQKSSPTRVAGLSPAKFAMIMAAVAVALLLMASVAVIALLKLKFSS